MPQARGLRVAAVELPRASRDISWAEFEPVEPRGDECGDETTRVLARSTSIDVLSRQSTQLPDWEFLAASAMKSAEFSLVGPFAIKVLPGMLSGERPIASSGGSVSGSPSIISGAA